MNNPSMSQKNYIQGKEGENGQNKPSNEKIQEFNSKNIFDEYEPKLKEKEEKMKKKYNFLKKVLIILCYMIC